MSSDKAGFRPMNVVVAQGSQAERQMRARAGLPGGTQAIAEAIAPGIPPRPRHDLIFHGGKTIPQLIYTNFFVGGQQAWKRSDIDNIDRALAAAMSDQNLNNVMRQYFRNRKINAAFSPSQILPGPKPNVFSQGDVEGLVTQLHAQGKLSGFALNTTVFNFMLPSGTVLNTNVAPTQKGAKPTAAAAEKEAGEGPTVNPARPEDEVSSLLGLGGYHGSVHVSNQETIYYAVGVFSETRADGTDNGIVAFDQPWKNVVATFYHELQEARTDADVEDAIKAGNDPQGAKFLGWMSRQGEECGDFPMSEVGPNLDEIMKEIELTDESGTVPVQFQYSNAVHGPEGPIPAPHPLRGAGHIHALGRQLRNELQLNLTRHQRILRALRALPRQGRQGQARRQRLRRLFRLNRRRRQRLLHALHLTRMLRRQHAALFGRPPICPTAKGKPGQGRRHGAARRKAGRLKAR